MGEALMVRRGMTGGVNTQNLEKINLPKLTDYEWCNVSELFDTAVIYFHLDGGSLELNYTAYYDGLSITTVGYHNDYPTRDVQFRMNGNMLQVRVNCSTPGGFNFGAFVNILGG